jgi:hypothetical protein
MMSNRDSEVSGARRIVVKGIVHFDLSRVNVTHGVQHLGDTIKSAGVSEIRGPPFPVH